VFSPAGSFSLSADDLRHVYTVGPPPKQDDGRSLTSSWTNWVVSTFEFAFGRSGSTTHCPGIVLMSYAVSLNTYADLRKHWCAILGLNQWPCRAQ
jgi:hypothetical protein